MGNIDTLLAGKLIDGLFPKILAKPASTLDPTKGQTRGYDVICIDPNLRMRISTSSFDSGVTYNSGPNFLNESLGRGDVLGKGASSKAKLCIVGFCNSLVDGIKSSKIWRKRHALNIDLRFPYTQDRSKDLFL